MSVTVTNPVSPLYYPNGTTTVFPFDFKVMSENEVSLVDADGDAVVGFSYSVTVAEDEGGTVIFDTAPAAADLASFRIISAPALGQPSEFGSSTTFNPRTLNGPFDRLAVQVIDLANKVGRTLRLPIGSSAIDLVGDRVGKFLSFDGSGNPIYSSGTGADAGLRVDLAGNGGAALSGFVQASSSAVARSIQAKLRDTINVKDFGATGDGATDDSTAIQNAVNAAIANKSHRVFFPFQNGERYNLGSSTITIAASGFHLVGDAAPLYNPDNNGYITGTAAVLFDYGGGSAAHATNQFTVDGLAFYTTGLTQTAIKATQDNNGPHRGMIFRGVSGKGFARVISIAPPTGANLGAATVVVEGCVFLGNTYSIYTDNRVFGLRFVGNQSEQGGRIGGKWDAGISIADSMLEGQSDPISVDSNSPTLDVRAAYFEAISGDYVMRIKGTNPAAIVTIQPSYMSSVTAADIVRVEGTCRVIEHKPITNLQTVTASPVRRAALTLHSVSMPPGSDITGRFYVPSASGRSAGYVNPLRIGNLPTSIVRKSDLGSVAFETPWGRTTQGVSVNGFPATYYTLTKSWASGDVMVACALVRVESGEQPYFAIYNESFAQPNIKCDQILIPNEMNGEWLLMFAVGPTSVAGTQAKFRFGSNGTGAGSTSIHPVALGVDVIPAANFETWNSQSRAFCRLFNPLPMAMRITQQVPPAVTYAAPAGGATVDAEARASLGQLATDVAAIRTTLANAKLTT